MASKRDIEAGRAYVALYVKNADFQKGLAAAQARLSSFGAAMTTAGAGLLGASAALAVPLAAALLDCTEAVGQLADIAARTGASVPALQELGYAADLTGASIDDVEAALRKAAKTTTEAAAGSKTAKEALDALGLTTADLAGLSPDKQFDAIAAGLAGIADPSRRAAAAMEVFGKSGTKLLPMIAELDSLRQRARDLGIVMSGEDIAAADKFGETLDHLKAGFHGVGRTLAAAVLPPLLSLAEMIGGAIGGVIRWVKDNRELVATIAQVALTIGAAGAALIGLGAAIKVVAFALGGIGTALSTAGALIAGTFAVVKGLILATLSPIGLLIAGAAILGAAFVDWGSVFDYLKGLVSDFFNDFKETWGGIADAIAAGDLALAGQVAWAGLQVIWQRGTAELNKLWQDAKWYFLTVWNEATTAIAGFFVTAWAKVKSAWTTTIAFLQSAWTTFSEKVANTWNTMQKGAGAALIAAAEKAGIVTKEHAQAWREDLDRDLTQKQTDRTAAAEARRLEIEDQRAKDLAAIDTDLAQQRQAIEDQRQAANAGYDAQRDQALADKQAALEAAQAELAAMRGQAAEAKAKKDRERPDQQKKKLPDPGDLAAGMKSVGTFSGAAAALMGGGANLQGRIADNTARTNAALWRLIGLSEDTIDAIEAGAMTFGES
jgi:hypothetical protein